MHQLSTGEEGTRLVGERRAFVAKAKQAIEVARATVQAGIAEEESIKQYIEAINYGASRQVMDRTCLRLKGEILKLVGEEKKVVIQILHDLGVSSEDELRRMVTAVQSADTRDIPSMIELWTKALVANLNLFPEYRESVIRQLGGYVPVQSDRVAGG